MQVLIGIATWRVKYYLPTWFPQPAFLDGYTVTAESMLQTITITAHVAMGSLILAMAAYLTAKEARALFNTRMTDRIANEAKRTDDQAALKHRAQLEVIT